MSRHHKSANNTASSKKNGTVKRNGDQRELSLPVLRVHCPRGVPGSPVTEKKIDDCIVFCEDIDSYIKRSPVRHPWDSFFFENDTNTFFYYMTFRDAHAMITYHTSSRLQNHMINAPETDHYSCQPIFSPRGILCKPASVIVRELFNFLIYELNIFQNIHERCSHAIGKYVGEFIDKFVRLDQGTYCINLMEWDEFLIYGRRFFRGLQKKEPIVLEEDDPYNDYAFVAFLHRFESLCRLLHCQDACGDVDQCALRFISDSDSELDDEDYCDSETEDEESDTEDEESETEDEEIETEDEESETEDVSKSLAQCITEVENGANQFGETATNAKNTQGITVATQAGTPLGEKNEQEILVIANQRKEIERLGKLVAEKNEKINAAKLESEKMEKKFKAVVCEMQKKLDDQQKIYMQAEKNKETKLEKELVDMKKQLEKKDKSIEHNKQQADKNWKELKKATKEIADLKMKLEEKEMKNNQKQQQTFMRELKEMRRRLNEKDAIIEGNKRQAQMNVEELKDNRKQIHHFLREVTELRKRLNEKDAIIDDNKTREKKNEQMHKKVVDELEQRMRSNMPSTSTAEVSYGNEQSVDYFLAYIEEANNVTKQAEKQLTEFLDNTCVNSEIKRAMIEMEDFQMTLGLYRQKAQKNMEVLMADEDAESDQLLVHIPEMPRPFSKLTYKKMEEAREKKWQDLNPECDICIEDLNNGTETWACTRCTCKCHYNCFTKGVEATTSKCFKCREPVVDDKEFPAPQPARR